MKRVNDFEFYQLATAIHPVTQIQDEAKAEDVWYMLYSARRWLDYLLADDLIPLVVTKPVGLLLLQEIKELLDKYPPKPLGTEENKFSFSETYPVRTKAREFETILSAELQSLATYFVSQKLAYETRILIEEAERMIPENVRSDLDDKTIDEIRQAGRCIAFEIPTAAGFHIIRATESVIRQYYAAVLGKIPRAKMRNWGAYIKNLRDSGKADAGILAILDHIRETYRNPVLHPEVSLDANEAQITTSVCLGAVVQMVLAIQARKKAAENAVAELLARNMP